MLPPIAPPWRPPDGLPAGPSSLGQQWHRPLDPRATAAEVHARERSSPDRRVWRLAFLTAMEVEHQRPCAASQSA